MSDQRPVIPRITCLMHHAEDCEICRTTAELYDWSIRELTRFMCTDETTPETDFALDVFRKLAP